MKTLLQTTTELMEAYSDYRKLGWFAWYFRTPVEFGRRISLKTALYHAEILLKNHYRYLPDVVSREVDELAQLCWKVDQYMSVWVGN